MNQVGYIYLGKLRINPTRLALVCVCQYDMERYTTFVTKNSQSSGNDVIDQNDILNNPATWNGVQRKRQPLKYTG